MVRVSPRLQSNVNEAEDAELRRLECGSDGGQLEEATVPAEGRTVSDNTVASVEHGSDGAMVKGAAQRHNQLVPRCLLDAASVRLRR